MSQCCLQDAGKDSNKKLKSNYNFTNCDEPISSPHRVIRLHGGNKSGLLSSLSLCQCRGTKTTLFIFISVIILPQQHSLFSSLAPLSLQAEGSPFMTIWQGTPSTAERFRKLLCARVASGQEKNLLALTQSKHLDPNVLYTWAAASPEFLWVISIIKSWALNIHQSSVLNQMALVSTENASG